MTAPIHVATPEGITPCGEGGNDVTTTAVIAETTCLECLRTLAQAPQPDIAAASSGVDHRVARLEAEVRELHTAMEHLGRRVEYLGAQMSSSQAAIRGVGNALEEHAEAHLAYAAGLEARLQCLEGPGSAGADG